MKTLKIQLINAFAETIYSVVGILIVFSIASPKSLPLQRRAKEGWCLPIGLRHKPHNAPQDCQQKV